MHGTCMAAPSSRSVSSRCQADGLAQTIETCVTCSPATSQPLLHGKAMAQRTHIDVQPVKSLFQHVKAFASESSRRAAAEPDGPQPSAASSGLAPYPQVGLLIRKLRGRMLGLTRLLRLIPQNCPVYEADCRR